MNMMNRTLFAHGKDVEYTGDSEEKKGTWIFLNHKRDARVLRHIVLIVEEVEHSVRIIIRSETGER